LEHFYGRRAGYDFLLFEHIREGSENIFHSQLSDEWNRGKDSVLNIENIFKKMQKMITQKVLLTVFRSNLSTSRKYVGAYVVKILPPKNAANMAKKLASTADDDSISRHGTTCWE
jgi:hypothetical protein